MTREGEARSDEELVEAARRGDDSSFEVLFDRYSRYVLLLAARFGVTGDGALDLLQETFIVFFRKLPSFELRARLTTWLYPTVRNISLKNRHRGPRWLFLDDQAVSAARVPPQDDLVEGHHTVVKLLSSLPDAHREVLLLRYVDGMSLNEIALAAGIPEGTAKSRLHHALAALRAMGEKTLTAERGSRT